MLRATAPTTTVDSRESTRFSTPLSVNLTDAIDPDVPCLLSVSSTN